MKCPITFSDPCSDVEYDCIGRECAWWVVQRRSIGGDVHTASGCAVAVIAAKGLAGATIGGGESTEEDE